MNLSNKPHLNGDYYEYEDRPYSQAHDSIICRIQFYHEYLKNQYHQLAAEENSCNAEELLDRLINTHYEVFADFLFDPEQN